ncbi:hypothetical protein [Gordonia jacobaea]|uniref:hypothetical protein n=1 Tax=Gordonia jacobaea TaxID=122202 RepID=UPI003D72875B
MTDTIKLEDMTTDPQTNDLGTVRVEVLGRSDYLTPGQAAILEELPAYLHAEGVGTEAVYFREPGGMGFGLETIALFVVTSGAAGFIGGAVWDGTKATARAAIAWARERIRRYRDERGDDLHDDEDPVVRVNIYGPIGAVLRIIEVRESGVDDPIGDNETE